MVTVKEKMVVTQKLSATCPTHARCDISVRDVETVTDEPLDRDGTNLGLTPTETLSAALIGCTNNIATKIAHKAGLDFEVESVDVEADFDRRGVTLQEELDVPFEEIRLFITVRTTASDEEIAKVKHDLPRFCAISKVIRHAGTRIVENWTIKRP